MKTDMKKSVKVLRFALSLILTAMLSMAVKASWADETDSVPAAPAPSSALVFVAGDRGETSIIAVDPAGGMPLTLVTRQTGALNTQPAVSADGRLAWIRRLGGIWQLLDNGEVISEGPQLRLSPAYRPGGGLAAALSDERETSIYLFEAGVPRLLMRGQDGLVVSPSFSPDGQQFAYVSNESGLGRIHLAETGGGASRLLVGTAGRATDPCWSPKGDLIAFVNEEKDIYIVQPDGREMRQLTRDQGVNSHPVFSPDGLVIAFASDRDGMERIYLMNIDGTDQRPLLPGLEVPQSYPVWSSAWPKKPEL